MKDWAAGIFVATPYLAVVSLRSYQTRACELYSGNPILRTNLGNISSPSQNGQSDRMTDALTLFYTTEDSHTRIRSAPRD